MSKLGVGSVLLCLVAGLAVAQTAADIRSPSYDPKSAEGGLISQALLADDAAQKVQFLSAFIEKYGAHSAAGFAHYQLSQAYVETGDYDKAVESAQFVLKIAPDDLEFRHNMIKALEGKQDWDSLLTNINETKDLADKATGPKPAEVSQDEWNLQTEYAQGIHQYLEYSLYTSMFTITDPATKAGFGEALRQHYPDGEYGKLAAEQLALAYQQAGDFEKMLGVMRDSVAQSPTNETFLYTLAESSIRSNELDQANQYAKQLVDLMETKQKPEAMADADWGNHKTLFTAYGNFILGRVLVIQENYRGGRTLLLETVDPLKAAGGENYGILAYFLGICYVKLDVQGDNIAAARNWLGVASNTASPYQSESKNILSKLPPQ